MTPGASEPHIGVVVEGRGELAAVPILLRKHLQARQDYRDIIGKPIPCYGRDKALMPDGIEGKVATAAARPGCGGVLVILDGEGDAVCTLGPELLTRVQDATYKPTAVCLADTKFEAWIVASGESMDLHIDPASARDPVAVVKEALAPKKYVKPTWQPRLTDRIDFELALPRSESLRRTLERFDTLVSVLS